MSICQFNGLVDFIVLKETICLKVYSAANPKTVNVNLNQFLS